MKRFSVPAFCAMAAVLLARFASAQGTAFTYQGRLNDTGQPANGLYDLRFTIYDAAASGTGEAGPLTNSATGITNGLFTVVLDFGSGVFTGPGRWLQIEVRTNGGVGFTALSPRQGLTSAPYAVFAGSASNIVGFLTGNGAGLTNVNAATVGGVAATNLWQTGGNLGTTAGINFLGTIDNQPVELHAGGLRILRLEPGPATAGAPNVIGGAPLNAVPPGIEGATIAGGGITNFLFGFPVINSVSSAFGTIGGGWGNAIQSNSFSATIAGGVGNVIETNATEAIIGGGNENTVLINANDATLNGGLMNSVAAAYTTLGGGVKNSIQPAAPGSTIGGGATNIIQSQAAYATVAGGNNNIIGASYASLGGGYGNEILATAQDSTIAGGYGNYIQAANGTIGGGANNGIQGNSSEATIGGGANNSILPGASSSVISGGGGNATAAQVSFIGGGQINTIQYSAFNAAIVAGLRNLIQTNAENSFLGGGVANTIYNSDYSCVIAGGQSNQVGHASSYSFIGGGDLNAIESFADHSVIAGGTNNTVAAGATFAVMGGGAQNVCSGSAAAVAGGQQNTSSGSYSTVAGGAGNLSSGEAAMIGGGAHNVSSGLCSTVPGGEYSQASGAFSFAAGFQAQALHRGSFVWADSQGGAFSSTLTNEFAVRAGGGVVFQVSGSSGLNPAALLINSTSANGVALQAAQTSSDATAVFANAGPGDLLRGFSGPSAANLVFQVQNNGTVCAANVSCASDRNLKAGFGPVAADSILTKVAALPISRWHYTNDVATSHIGPMAQDFYAAFGVGPDDKHITTLDEGGVALVAIQGLIRKVQEKDAEIHALTERLARLEELVRNGTGP